MHKETQANAKKEGSARPLIQYEKGEGGGGEAHHATRQQVCAHKARQGRLLSHIRRETMNVVHG